MASAIKKTTVEDLVLTLSTILGNIDKSFVPIKQRLKNLPACHGYDNHKEFLKQIEKNALKKTCEELGLGSSTVRERWKIMTLPLPVFDAIETGEISFSKAKPLTAINFDFDNDGDSKVAEDIIEFIKDGATLKDIKVYVEEKSSEVWNESNIVMQRIAEQNGVTADGRY